ncbi:MAG: MFS transporter [Chloroflexi bacterium]|nr:MFS transporter [Chloroflexota bacterium]
MARIAAGPLGRIAEPFSARGFRPLWGGAVLFALGGWMERVAVGWYVFDQTDSAFITALATAAHIAPGLLIGPIAGAISDRRPRHLILMGAALLKAAALVVIAFLVRGDEIPLLLIVALVAVSGAGNALNISSLHTLSGDLVGAERRARAISVVSTGQRAISAIGAFSSGAIISAFGAAHSFLVGALAMAAAAVLYHAVGDPVMRRSRSGTTFLSDTIEGLRIVARIRLVAILLLLTALVEVFGFAFMSLLPAVADRLLGVGATGLGALSGAASIGGVVGTLALAAYAERGRLGTLFLGVVTAFGVLMIFIGLSPWFLVSLVIACGIGAMAAMFDTLQWIMLQAGVSDELRGRVLGAWNVAIGFGWIGPLILGAVADLVSVTAAFALAGAILLLTAALAGALSPRLRSA